MMAHFQLSHFHLLFLLMAALLEYKVATQRPCEQLQQLNISRVQRDSMSIPCLSTTHPLESLTVKLRKNNPVQDILISPASEHQRWSVRKHAGNIQLDLKDIQLTDEGLYDCEVYKDQDCLNAARFNLTVKECKRLESVSATLGSSVLLPCSEHPQQHTTDQVTWKVIEGHRSTDITQYRSSSKTSNSTEKLLKPLFERARELENRSLLIRNSVKTDELWYRCRVNDKTCYEVKLQFKDETFHSLTTFSTAQLDPPTPSKSPVGLLKGDTAALTASIITNLTVVVMATIACVILYFKTRRNKNNSQIELNCKSSVCYSKISGEFDVLLPDQSN
ncbi:uncharacterized protein LOC130243581 isoform X2 [Danio aesculapii]|uniref:uncharacterized protein LOC130243581 isoform X2 n=1 Tax=Danio aesculapii TaxID=1142201 RepID=UPI0024C04660|nr:uncharacterized protein LOC130243581 isoform X2 [Danio aesculapii]